MANISNILEERLATSQVRTLREAGKACADKGAALFLVGGSVRDMLLGQRPADIDLSVAQGGPETADFLASELDGEVVFRSQFNTAKIRVDDAAIDLAMARKETYDAPGALPVVSPGSVEEDLARRDFSINSMAVSLSPGSWGELLDPHGGKHDLASRLIRTLHAASFIDDATRILRAVRYAQRLGFGLDGETEEWLKRDLANLDHIGGDRVRHELERIFQEERAVPMLAQAQHLGILAAIFPALHLVSTVSARLEERKPAAKTEDNLVLMSVLAYSVSTADLPRLAGRLNMGTQWKRVVTDTCVVRDAASLLGAPSLTRSRIHTLLRTYDPVAVRGCALATDSPAVAQRLELYDTELRHVRTALNGDDLIAMGVPQGPAVGEVLDELLSRKLDGRHTVEEDERQFVERWCSQNVT